MKVKDFFCRPVEPDRFLVGYSFLRPVGRKRIQLWKNRLVDAESARRFCAKYGLPFPGEAQAQG